MPNEILPAEQPIVAYNAFRMQLVELRELNKATVFDYEDEKGNKDARSHVYKLRQTKTAVDKARKDEKDTSLQYGRRVDAEAKEIIEEIQGMIDVHAKPLADIEAREEERKQSLLSKLDNLLDAGEKAEINWLTVPRAELLVLQERVEGIALGEEFWQEYAERAAELKAGALKKIRKAVKDRAKHDEEQADLAALREEKERRDLEDQGRAAAAEKDRIAKEAAETATKEAEQRAADEKKQTAERAKRREAQLKLDAETAKRQAAEAEDRARQKLADEEATEKKAAEERENDKKLRKAVLSEAVKALVRGGLTPDSALLAIELIFTKKIPNVTINF